MTAAPVAASGWEGGSGQRSRTGTWRRSKTCWLQPQTGESPLPRGAVFSRRTDRCRALWKPRMWVDFKEGAGSLVAGGFAGGRRYDGRTLPL